jgi:chromate transporter
VWFGWAVVRPAEGGVDWFAIIVGVAAFVALQRLRAGMIPVIVVSGVLGLGWHLVAAA